MMRAVYLAAAITALGSGGCASFSSTALQRFDDNSFVGNSNGESKHFGQARPFKGIPITLKVPTHLDIYIDEVYFLKLGRSSATEILDGTSRLLHVRTELVKSDKIFVVDFKRPGSGTLDIEIEFDEEEQYFKKIVSELEDETITDTAELIANVTGVFSGLPASTAMTEQTLEKLAGAEIVRDTRVVAYQRFDINSSTFEQDVECFVDVHLNHCNRCGTKPDYDAGAVLPVPSHET